MSTQIGHLTPEQAREACTPWTQLAPRIGRDEYLARLERAQRLLDAAGAGALLVTAGTSLRYFTGIPWGATERLVAMLLPRRGEPVLICPAFEEGSLRAELAHPMTMAFWEEHEDPCALVAACMASRGASTLALDPAAPFNVFTGLAHTLGTRDIVDATPVIDGCRARKSATELALMKQACAMTLKVQALAAGMLHEGIAAGDVKRFIDGAHRALGADNGSTFCIVQFGVATSYPHGVPGEQYLEKDQVVLIDTGCSVAGYQSDITRTYVFGAPDAEQSRIWNLERAAQQAAFDAVRPGVPCADIDAAARRVIEAGGLGPDYRLPGLPHRTGHGCGMAIHEAPYLVRGNTAPLAPGNCCSDEPMIVVPGRFGIRLEDHFYVTDDGGAWFTEPSPSIEQPFA
ncbi:MAG: Xaa-Pro peptidase family protein [Luteibacter sp.]|uniref:M24 family metallopeptidase n=1 Tax=Luteibacter TaxID=242605 RepID=UPI0005652776|nr:MULTISPECIES: Xaa-Pro peptidase family protein [unclassified Luteibacter]MDQ7994906.1 Xaa-Pro peptidase family protein [Luteibacter sp.]MDQ8047580.1 Xaa-Pro peptidase family protein [Luteibacter sp.]